MYKRRFLALLCSLSLVGSLLCGVAYGAAIPNLDEMGIDPWGDFAALGDPLTPSQGPMVVSDEGLEDFVYAMDEDAGIMPMAFVDGGQKFSIAIDGSPPQDNIDDDGDEWDCIQPDFVFAPVDNRDYTATLSQVGHGSRQYAEIGWRQLKRPTQLNSKIWASQYVSYLGRPSIVNGDPGITMRSRLSSSKWNIHYRLDSFEATEGVESITLLDYAFAHYPILVAWLDNETGFDWGDRELVRGGQFTGAYLFVNGVQYERLLTSHSGSPGSSGFVVEISNTTINFPAKTYVESLEIVLSYDMPAVTSKADVTGGVGIIPNSFTPSVMSAAKLSVTADTSSENTGLLKGIIEFLQTIVNGIKNIATAIVELPGKIANLIIEGIKSLFIPDESSIQEIKDKYFTLLEERLGFVWQAMSFVTDFGSSFLHGLETATDYTFEFPGLSLTLPDGTYQVMEAQTVSFDNGLMDIVRPAVGTIVAFVVVFGFLRVSEGMVVALVSGKSYFDYLKGEGDTE